MIFPWHTDLFQPGRTVCVVFRASPLIWPTSFGAHHAPRPLTKVHPRWFSTRGYGCWGLRPYHDQSHRDCLRGSGDGVRNVCFSQRERLCLHYPIVGPAWHPRHVEI